MASGDTLCTFVAPGESPATNGSVFTTRNEHPVESFDDTTNQSIIFSGILPQHYGGGGVTVYLHWTAVAVTGDVDWDVAWENLVAQDIDSDGFAAVNSADNNAPSGTSGIPVIDTVAFTDGADMDSVDKGNAFRLKITRDASSDTMTGDAELIRVEVRET
jgi:hypothetical protein